MEKLKRKKFRATDWARPSITIEGSLTVRDRKTLKPIDAKTNRNGYVVCIENKDGVHIVSPDSVELI